MCGGCICGWVSYGFKLGLVFGVRLYVCCGFEVGVVALRAFLILVVFIFTEGVSEFAVCLVTD